MTRENETVTAEINRLQELLRRKRASLPRHSVRPYQLLEIEELEERLAALQQQQNDRGGEK